MNPKQESRRPGQEQEPHNPEQELVKQEAMNVMELEQPQEQERMTPTWPEQAWMC